MFEVRQEFWLLHKTTKLQNFAGKEKSKKESARQTGAVLDRPSSVCLPRRKIEQSKAKSSGMFWNGLMLPPFEVNSLSLRYLIRWPRSMAQTHRLPERSAVWPDTALRMRQNHYPAAPESHFRPICLLNLTPCKEETSIDLFRKTEILVGRQFKKNLKTTLNLTGKGTEFSLDMTWRWN